MLLVLQELLGTFDVNGRNVEVVFCFDTTGSMYSCLEMVSEQLQSIIIFLASYSFVNFQNLRTFFGSNHSIH